MRVTQQGGHKILPYDDADYAILVGEDLVSSLVRYTPSSPLERAAQRRGLSSI